LQRHLVANNGEYPLKGDASGLGKWIIDQRRWYNKPEDDPARLSPERIELLERLRGWTWRGQFKRPTTTGSRPQPKKRREIETSSSDETMGDFYYYY
jgi:hypothetical protein